MRILWGKLFRQSCSKTITLLLIRYFWPKNMGFYFGVLILKSQLIIILLWMRIMHAYVTPFWFQISIESNEWSKMVRFFVNSISHALFYSIKGTSPIFWFELSDSCLHFTFTFNMLSRNPYNGGCNSMVI